MSYRSIVVFALALAGAACTTAPVDHSPYLNLGSLWVKHAAEYRALSLQVYQAATDALPGFIEDRSWTVVPGNPDVRDLPPAVILDVDETVVSNVDFQLTFEPPFENWKLNKWNDENVATAVPGVAAFVAAAREAGAAVFFVTNRPCELIEGVDDPCPQKAVTIQDIAEAGIETDADHVFLAREQGWTREKVTRREHVAKTHRVIMLIGDDLGDFIPCVRDKLYTPCTITSTAASRQLLLEAYSRFWGRGWYVLPNPMHGSWTSQLP